MNARYFVQIFDFKRAQSLQRTQQILIDQPLQLFYVFDEGLSKNQSAPSPKQQHKSLIQLVANQNSSASPNSDELTFRVHPIERNKVLVRIENLAGRFDINNGN